MLELMDRFDACQVKRTVGSELIDFNGASSADSNSYRPKPHVQTPANVPLTPFIACRYGREDCVESVLPA